MRRVYVVRSGKVEEYVEDVDFGLTLFDSDVSVGGGDGYGIAVDFGTTTVAAALVRLSDGKVLKVLSGKNTQCEFGGDVVSRISACTDGKLGKLRDLANWQISAISAVILTAARIKTLPKQTVVSGNTVMLHILAGEDPTPIGEYPYTPVFTDGRQYTGKELDLHTEMVRLMPSVSGYIGGDVVAGLLSLNKSGAKPPYLLVDLGTNGEIALVTDDKIYCASAAVGPAFEGGSIECGMPAMPGAVDKVNLSGDEITVSTIGGKTPCGICGSGLVDAVSVLLRRGDVGEDGTLYSSSNRVEIADGVYLSQKDVRQYQLAKSAVYTAISMLLTHACVKCEDITAVYLAGGMGTFINPNSAASTGLIPKKLKDKTVAVGNSSLSGARLYLYDDGTAAMLKEKAETLILSDDPDFERLFLANLNFDPEA